MTHELDSPEEEPTKEIIQHTAFMATPKRESKDQLITAIAMSMQIVRWKTFIILIAWYHYTLQLVCMRDSSWTRRKWWDSRSKMKDLKAKKLLCSRILWLYQNFLQNCRNFPQIFPPEFSAKPESAQFSPLSSRPGVYNSAVEGAMTRPVHVRLFWDCSVTDTDMQQYSTNSSGAFSSGGHAHAHILGQARSQDCSNNSICIQ